MVAGWCTFWLVIRNFLVDWMGCEYKVSVFSIGICVILGDTMV